jgi:hypothetical protein
MRKYLVNLFAVSFLATTFFESVSAQSSLDDKFGRIGLNTITTAVPFLLIAPDSRAGAMGDAGVATSADVNSIHWNPSKLAFADKDMGFAISYIPWLRKLVPDINLSYLSFYKKVDNYQTFGASMRYFTLGDIQFTDEFGNNTIQFRPNEFAVDLAYSRKLSEYFSGGVALRYVNSNLTGSINVQGAASNPGRAIAMDVSAYYQNSRIKMFGKKSEVAAGINVSNIGNKMSYTQTSKRDFIPINLRIGPRVTFNLDDYNKLTITADINKLLVPTPPLYKIDNGKYVFDSEGNPVILAGKDPNRAVASGMFGSFNDAPGEIDRDEKGNIIYNADGTAQLVKGSVFREEMRELTYSAGLEYWYDNQFAVRAGYFHENQLKGNRKYLTIGTGLKYNVFGLDFAYLIPTFSRSNAAQRSPLQNTLRFTLTFDFAALKEQNESVN